MPCYSPCASDEQGLAQGDQQAQAQVVILSVYEFSSRLLTYGYPQFHARRWQAQGQAQGRGMLAGHCARGSARAALNAHTGGRPSPARAVEQVLVLFNHHPSAQCYKGTSRVYQHGYVLNCSPGHATEGCPKHCTHYTQWSIMSWHRRWSSRSCLTRAGSSSRLSWNTFGMSMSSNDPCPPSCRRRRIRCGLGGRDDSFRWR